AWYVLASSGGYSYGSPANLAVGWGLPGDVPVPGDYDGDGRADLAVYRPGTGAWYVLASSGGYAYGSPANLAVGWGGLPGDVPVPSGGYSYGSPANLAVGWGLPGDVTAIG